MKLHIVHETLYTYHQPVHFGQHRLVLRPREGHDLHVESMRLTIEPAFELVWGRDVFGNSVATVEFLEAAQELRILSEVEVVRSSPFPRPARLAAANSWPAVYDPLEKIMAAAYQQSVYPSDVPAVQRWLSEARLTAPASVEAAILSLNTYIHRNFAYKRRQETGVQSPAETIALRAGSCRDLATLLLEAARALGVAARFASGYLECRAAELGEAST
ncbi:MAG: transglutaminase family protein, partial [Acidobacteriota bacterium]